MKRSNYILALSFLLIFLSSCKREDYTVKKNNLQNSETLQFRLKDGTLLNVKKINGEYLLNGDIMLSDKQVEYYQSDVKSKTPTTKAVYVADPVAHWPNGRVFYVINDESNREEIIYAINHLEEKTKIDFIERTNQANYIDFSGNAPMDGAAGSSYVGMIGGRQEIRLTPNLGSSKQVVIHEIGHALGLIHEQNRPDRDEFININYQNINSSFASQYDKYRLYNFQYVSTIGFYDFDSVMGYSSFYSSVGFPGNNTPQITKKDGSTFNQGNVLSQNDIKAINAIYTPLYFTVTLIKDSTNNSGLDIYKNVHVKLDFYSDFNKTIPITLPANINFFAQIGKAQYENGMLNHTWSYQSFDVEESRGSFCLYSGLQKRIYYNAANEIKDGSFYNEILILKMMHLGSETYFNYSIADKF